MKNIAVMKDSKMSDIFDPEDKVINIMTPNTFSARKYGLPEKGAFLYKGYPMYLDRTVIHARKEDKAKVDELLKEDIQLIEISNKLLNNYMKKSGDDMVSAMHKQKAGRPVDWKKVNKRSAGYNKAHSKVNTGRYSDKNSKSKLEVESVQPIDEISVKKLSNYMKKADDEMHLAKDQMKHAGSKEEHDSGKKWFNKRSKGYSKAHQKLDAKVNARRTDENLSLFARLNNLRKTFGDK